MNLINSPNNTLAAIEQKVRRLTRSPSEAQLTTADLDNYINTFVVYDFPEHLRMFNLRTTFKFWTNPFQDTYPTDIASFGTASNPQVNPLYNFQNNYISIHRPLYIAGFPSLFAQNRENFFGIYPIVQSISSIGPTGNGVATTFSGVVVNQGSFSSVTPGLNQTACFLKNNVLFESIDINNNGLQLVDVPCLDGVTGNPTVWGNLYVPSSQDYIDAKATPPLITNYTIDPATGVPITGVNPNNYFNYVTGAFTITFPVAPQQGTLIQSQTVPQIVSLPQAMLFYDNKIILRPVPDQCYEVNFEAYIRPTMLIGSGAVPGLEEWWQYIAYGAAKKIFEDKMDLDSVALIMPEYKKQETLCLRRTIVQYTNERTATIYTEQTGLPGGQGWWGWSGSNF